MKHKNQDSKNSNSTTKILTSFPCFLIASPKHTLHSQTTKIMCLVCNVSLCRVKRYDGKSCHELFHSSISLVDNCRAAMDDVVHVVPHSNRPGPPNQQKVTTSSAIAKNSGTNSEDLLKMMSNHAGDFVQESLLLSLHLG